MGKLLSCHNMMSMMMCVRVCAHGDRRIFSIRAYAIDLKEQITHFLLHSSFPRYNMLCIFCLWSVTKWKKIEFSFAQPSSVNFRMNVSPFVCMCGCEMLCYRTWMGGDWMRGDSESSVPPSLIVAQKCTNENAHMEWECLCVRRVD